MRRLNLLGKKVPRVRGFFNGLCTLVLIILFYNNGDFVRNSILGPSSSVSIPKSSSRGGFSLSRRGMVESSVDNSKVNDSDPNRVYDEAPTLCSRVHHHKGFNSSCEFLKAHPECESLDGYLDYMKFYYCTCNGSAWTLLVLGVWLAALFYLLGNTAADYFCCSLEKLSSLLKFSPTVAGVALLPLGNGAPDVFASIASFVGSADGEVGLNSVLGGAVFVTCVVAGAVALCVFDQDVQIDKKCFIRDIMFFIFTIMALMLMLFVGKVTVWAAIAFISIYVVYAFAVAANEILREQAQKLKLDVVTPLLPVRGSVFSPQGNQEDEAMFNSLLEQETTLDGSQSHQPCLPQWMWATNVAIYSNQVMKIPDGDKNLWGWTDEDVVVEQPSFSCSKLCSLLELPLTVPRRLTIPLVEEENWSKVYAVGCALFAPILLACIWSSQQSLSSEARTIAYILGVSIGCMLCIIAYKHTRAERPPQKFLLPWVLGGFLMSIVWFYLIANELVSLLVAIGLILGVHPPILGVTVLAWGNSMGDLVSDVALSMNGGDGVQIALSGCYAGPMFNTLIGLGISMLLGAGSSGSFTVPQDTSLYYTLGFLLLGLVWALVMLPKNDMRPSKMLGVGLIVIYLVFLSLRVGSAMGVVSLLGLP